MGTNVGAVLMEIFLQARMGVHECVTHKLIDPFQVLYDKVLGFKSNLILIFYLLFFRRGPTSLSTSSQYCWCPTAPIKSQVPKIETPGLLFVCEETLDIIFW